MHPLKESNNSFLYKKSSMSIVLHCFTLLSFSVCKFVLHNFNDCIHMNFIALILAISMLKKVWNIAFRCCCKMRVRRGETRIIPLLWLLIYECILHANVQHASSAVYREAISRRNGLFCMQAIYPDNLHNCM